MVFACDEWDKIEHNAWAVAKTIDALRGIDRWGSGDMLERAFTGFQALPPAGKYHGWRNTLGIPEGITVIPDQVKSKYRELSLKYHPDRGGDPTRMAEINRAYEDALKELNA